MLPLGVAACGAQGAPMKPERRALTLARWVKRPAAGSLEQPQFMFDRGEPAAPLQNVSLVLPSTDLSVMRARLAAGARQVLLADGTLRDMALIQSAVAEFGGTRVGAWLPLRRMEVCWALDSHSNGDFKCMVPSNPQARWEVLSVDRQRTGTEAGGWIDRLARSGVKTVLVSVDMQDDRDLDLCAGLMERFGDLLWFSPLDETTADFASWVEFGQVSRLVLPDGAAGDAVAKQLTERFGSPRAAAERVA